MIALYQPFQNRTIPCFAPPHLPPLSKGGGLTARHKLSLCCVLLAIHPPFLFTKLFAVKTEGLSHHPSLSATSMPPLVKGEVLSPDKIRATTGGIATPLSLAPHNILASLVKWRWIDGKAQTVALLHFYLRYIRLFNLSTFLPSRRRDCYTTLRLAPHSWLPCQRELDCDKAISYYKLQHSAISSTLIFAQPYLSQD